MNFIRIRTYVLTCKVTKQNFSKCKSKRKRFLMCRVSMTNIKSENTLISVIDEPSHVSLMPTWFIFVVVVFYKIQNYCTYLRSLVHYQRRQTHRALISEASHIYTSVNQEIFTHLNIFLFCMTDTYVYDTDKIIYI